MNRQRLSAEALRDSILAVAGTLNRKLGGPMVRVPLEPEVYDLIFTEGEPDGLVARHPDVREHTRRSLYLFAKRNVRQPLLEAFDQPDTLTSCPVRPVSTFAPQALILLNGPLTQQQSQAFAVRLLRAASDRQGRIDLAFRLALSRPPRPDETQLVETFLRKSRRSCCVIACGRGCASTSRSSDAPRLRPRRGRRPGRFLPGSVQSQRVFVHPLIGTAGKP